MTQRDRVTITALPGNGGRSITIDRATQYEIVRDLTAPSEARFELGDESTFEALQDALEIGTRFRVAVNGTDLMVGRALVRNPVTSASAGSTVQLTVRTRLADAMFSSCNPSLNFRGATLERVIIDAYASIGLTAADLDIREDLQRNLFTGTTAGGRDKSIKVMFPDEARVHAPETVHQYCERQLARFGLAQWDGVDGRIVIGAPDDTQSPRYRFQARRAGRGARNNAMQASRIEDYEAVPDELMIAGYGSGFNALWARIKATQRDPKLEAVSPKLFRRAIVADGGIWSQGQADARANKEMSARSRQKDAYQFEVDGWTQNGELYDVDTTADVAVDGVGGLAGTHLVWRVELRGSASEGQVARISTVAKGIWKLK